MAKVLSEFGISPRKIVILPDEVEAISIALAAAVKDYELIIAAGGLGPTFDDLTVEAVAKAFSLELKTSEAALQHIS
ncbi:MAG: competence/damage-inducible protein A, partial [Deferribacteraceae bacterium]|nr:competence/damage-inducible protein A [Deferribacteraceae bacterium]